MYHLSFKDLGTKCVLEPKIPERMYHSEKKLPERVCFSTSLPQCILGVFGIDCPEEFNFEIEFQKAISFLISSSIDSFRNIHSTFDCKSHEKPFLKKKDAFPDHFVDMLDRDISQYPKVFIDHFTRKNKKMIDTYEKHIFSKSYFKDRNLDFFNDVNTFHKNNAINMACYRPISDSFLETPNLICDFGLSDEKWSLVPLVVKRIGYLDINALSEGNIVLTHKNTSIINLSSI